MYRNGLSCIRKNLPLELVIIIHLYNMTQNPKAPHYDHSKLHYTQLYFNELYSNLTISTLLYTILICILRGFEHIQVISGIL